jgi:hypothetical protein
MAAEIRAEPELATAEPTVIWTPGSNPAQWAPLRCPVFAPRAERPATPKQLTAITAIHGQSPRSAGEPLAGKAVLCDQSPFRGSDRLASDVEPLIQHIVHAALDYIVAGRDRVLIFASPMSEPDINSVIEC